MKIIFSRKGFDSSAGGVPSPIIDGVPVSLPIPTSHRSKTTYDDLGLGEVVEIATKGRISANNLCHHDPMFENGRCAFGQTAAAQGHLANHDIGVGDIFLFFGLFAGLDGSDRHHRLFGYLQVEELMPLGANPGVADQPDGFSLRHPHTLGKWNANNTIYVGPGKVANMATDALRLSRPNNPVTHWRVPPWLREAGLTYHDKKARWKAPDSLTIVGRGQEFISDISGRKDALEWLDEIVSAINGKNDV